MNLQYRILNIYIHVVQNLFIITCYFRDEYFMESCRLVDFNSWTNSFLWPPYCLFASSVNEMHQSKKSSPLGNPYRSSDGEIPPVTGERFLFLYDFLCKRKRKENRALSKLQHDHYFNYYYLACLVWTVYVPHHWVYKNSF